MFAMPQFIPAPTAVGAGYSCGENIKQNLEYIPNPFFKKKKAETRISGRPLPLVGRKSIPDSLNPLDGSAHIVASKYFSGFNFVCRLDNAGIANHIKLVCDTH